MGGTSSAAMEQLHTELCGLHMLVGKPTVRHMLKMAALAGISLGRTALYDILNRRGVPTWRTVKAFVHTCVQVADAGDFQVEIPQKWRDRRWLQHLEDLRERAERADRSARADVSSVAGSEDLRMAEQDDMAKSSEPRLRDRLTDVYGDVTAAASTIHNEVFLHFIKGKELTVNLEATLKSLERARGIVLLTGSREVQESVDLLYLISMDVVTYASASNSDGAIDSCQRLMHSLDETISLMHTDLTSRTSSFG